jgi:hypothetical protein
MPGLVLEAIVKHIGFSFLLDSCLIANPHATVTNSRERQMKPQFLISGSIVLHDMRVGGDGTDEGVMVVVGDVLIDHLHDERHLRTVVVELHVVQLQVEDVPHPAVNRLVSNTVLRLTLGNPGRTAVRLESLLTPKRQQLISNLQVVVFEVLQPRKLLSTPNYSIHYHQGCALSLGMMFGQPFCSGEGGGIYDWLILAKIHGRMRSTF